MLGAQRAARSLCDAAPRDDNVEGGLDFWLTQAEIAFRYLAQVLGDSEVDTTSRTRTAGPESMQFNTTQLPLVPPHAARQMRPGGALLIHGTLPPAYIRTRAWWRDRQLSRRVPAEFDADDIPAKEPA